METKVIDESAKSETNTPIPMLDPATFSGWGTDHLCRLLEDLGRNPRQLLANVLGSVTEAEYYHHLLTRPEPYEPGHGGPPRPRLFVKSIDELVNVCREAARRHRPGHPRISPTEIYEHFGRDVTRHLSVGQWSPRQEQWLRMGLQQIATGELTELPPRPADVAEIPLSREEVLARARRSEAEAMRLRRKMICPQCKSFLPFGGPCGHCAAIAEAEAAVASV